MHKVRCFGFQLVLFVDSVSVFSSTCWSFRFLSFKLSDVSLFFPDASCASDADCQEMRQRDEVGSNSVLLRSAANLVADVAAFCDDVCRRFVDPGFGLICELVVRSRFLVSVLSCFVAVFFAETVLYEVDWGFLAIGFLLGLNAVVYLLLLQLVFSNNWLFPERIGAVFSLL